jgi:hypothetical protein
MSAPLREGRGPFRADQIRAGDYYELSDGHAIECSPAGRNHAGKNVSWAEILDTDPDVEWSGVDAGYSPESGTLRAPDVAVGGSSDGPDGWIAGSPPLAVEYAGAGQEEPKLQARIADLLAADTRFVWVVRLIGPQRVEVYEPEKPVRTLVMGEMLRAPGILRNPVPVEALFDRSAAHEVALRNLLQRRGYEGLDSVREEGHAEGRARGILEGEAALLSRLLVRRFKEVPPWAQERLDQASRDELELWGDRVLEAETIEDVFLARPASDH